MSVGPTPETVERILDRLETELVAETETRGPKNEGKITHLVGTWYLSAIHSQLVGLHDFGLLKRRDRLRFRFPFVTGDEPERHVLEAMAHRFVVAEVLTGETDHLRALSWQLVGQLVEQQLINRELEPDSMPNEFGTGNPIGIEIIQEELNRRSGHLANLQGQLRAALSFAEEAGDSFENVANSIREAIAQFEGEVAELERMREKELDVASEYESEIIATGTLLAGNHQIGLGDHLHTLRELVTERLSDYDNRGIALADDYEEFLRLIRQAFLGWLRALRGVAYEALGEFEYLWCEPTHSLATIYASHGEPYDDEPRGDEQHSN